jgi:hypothetical protein
MADSRAAVGLDRLPWLTDEPKVRRRPAGRSSLRELLGWGVAGALLLAGGSYWLGRQSIADRSPAPVEQAKPNAVRPEATIALPDARPAPASPEVAIAESPEVSPAPAATVSVAPPQRLREDVRRAGPANRRKLSPMDTQREALEQTRAEQEETESPATAAETAAPAPAVAQPPPAAVSRPAPLPANRYPNARRKAAKPQPLRLWPSRESAGASGRLVQIGAFGSRQQAKLGWRRMQRAYPAVGRLPAVVVETRNSRGKRFYRFQIGTTSQAHSEVLCQRMQSIRYSCAVVGLPWKSKVER